MKEHIDLNQIDFESSSVYDKLVAQERWLKRQAKKKAKADKASQHTVVETYQTRNVEDFTPFQSIFDSIRNLMSEGELHPVKVSRGGKNSELFEKQEFYLMNEQLVYIANKFEQYDESGEMVTYIHAVNEDKNEIQQPLSVFKILTGHMPKIEQLLFKNGKPALHAPKYK